MFDGLQAMSKSAHLVVNKHWKSTLVIEGPPGVVYKDLEGMGDLSEVGDPVAFDAEAMAALEEARRVSALPPSRGGKEELMYPSLEIVAKVCLFVYAPFRGSRLCVAGHS